MSGKDRHRLVNLRKSLRAAGLFLFASIFPGFLAPIAYAGALVNPKITPVDNAAGKATAYKVEFTTSVAGDIGGIGLPGNGFIKLYLYGNFDPSGVLIAAADTTSITGGMVIDSVVFTPGPINTSMIKIKRDATGNNVAGNTKVRLVIANVINPTVLNPGGDTYDFRIKTMNASGDSIDSRAFQESNIIVPDAVHHFTLSGYPTQVTAGQAWTGTTFSIVPRDRYDNQVTNFTNPMTIRFSSTDQWPQTLLPPDSVISGLNINQIQYNGNRFRLTRAGSQVVYVANSSDANVKTGTNPIKVNAAAINSFVLSTPVGVRAGRQFSLAVSAAQDVYTNLASGTVTVEPFARVYNAPDGTQPNLQAIKVTDGTGNAMQTLYDQEHSVQLRAVVGSVTNVSSPFYVGSGFNLGNFRISATYPLIVNAGSSFGGDNDVTVTALDTWGNDMVDGYTGTVSFSSSDAAASLPANYTYLVGESGVHTFDGTLFTFNTAGVQTFTVSDGAVSTTSKNISVTSGQIVDFDISVTLSQTAGVAFPVTITNARDAQGNLTSGTIAITFTDGGAHLAPNGAQPNLQTVTVANGTGSANQVLYRAESGVQFTATSTSHSEVSAAITISPGTALGSFGMTGFPVALVAGSSFGANNITVMVYDLWRNLKANYAGNVYFTSSDTRAVLPYTLSSQYTFTPADSGQKVFLGTGFILRTSGQQTITVTNGTISTVSSGITVQSGAIASFDMTVTTAQVAGASFPVTINNARDSENNFTSGDIAIEFNDGGTHAAPDGTLPNLQIVRAINGSGTANQTLYRAESALILRARSGSVSRTSAGITVAPGTSVGSYQMTGYPSTQVAGSGFGANNVTVSVFDRWENARTNHTGSIYFESSDASATVPHTVSTPYQFQLTDNGSRTFAGTGFNLRTIGQQTISVTDGSVRQTGSNILVTSSIITDFQLSVTTSQVAGVSFVVGISNARDANNNMASGTVTIEFNDGGTHVAPNGTLPALQTITVTAGSGTGTQVLYKAESGVVLRARASAVTRLSGPITVAPGTALAAFTLDGYPTSINAGSDFGANNVTVRAYDAWANVKSNYTGSIYFSSTDNTATLPYTSGSRYTFVLGDQGQKTFPGTSFTLYKAGLQRLTVTDGTVSATSNNINVLGGPIASFSFAPVTSTTAGQPFQLFVNNAFDDFNNPANGVVVVSAFSGGGAAPNGQTPIFNNIQVVNGTGSNQQVLVRTQPTVLVGNANGVTETTGTITVQPYSLNYFTLSGVPDSVIAGETFDVDTTIMVRAFDIYGNQKTNYTGTINFSSTTDPTAVLPANYTFAGADLGQKAFNGTLFKFNTAGNHTFTIRDNAAGISRSSDVIVAKNPDKFVIFDINASQATVTRGQTTPWYVDVILQNTGPRDINISFSPDVTFLRFYKGATNVTGEYAFSSPNQFLAGGTVLGRNESQTIRYLINKTGTTTGNITISARIQTVSGIVESSSSSNVYGGVEVQEQENVVIQKIWTSQATVTQNDNLRQWEIWIEIRNSGGSAVDIDLITSNIAFDNGTGFTWEKPVNLKHSGTDTLAAGATDSLKFTVTRTGSTLGQRRITASVVFTTLNTGQTNTTTTPSGREAYVTVQNPSELIVASVNPSRATITQSIQGEWSIQVLVRNNGQSALQVDLLSSFVQIEKMGEKQNDFVIIPPSALENSKDAILRGNTEDILKYTVTKTGADSGILNLVARIFATEINTGRLLNQVGVGNVTSQRKANLVYIPGSLRPTQVSQGSANAFIVRVSNTGQSILELSESSTRFSFVAGSVTFESYLNPASVKRVLPGDTTLTFLSRVVDANAPVGQYLSQVALIGQENGNPYNTAIFPDRVEVTEAAELAILQMLPSQTSVSSGQTRSWTVKMIVANNGGAGVRIDSLKINFHRLNLNLTSRFGFSIPTTFMKSGTNQLAGGSVDTLLFTINSVDANLEPGNIRIQGHLWVEDVTQPGRHLEQHTNGNSAFIVVQSPAQIVVKSITPSQSGVTPAQVKPWTIRVSVENRGGSEVNLDVSPVETFLKFQKGNNNFHVITSNRFVNSNDTRLRAGVTDFIDFVVDTVSASVTSGDCNLDVRVRTIEINSGRAVIFDTQQGGGTGIVRIETPPRLRVENVLTVSPRAGFVNRRQAYQARVRVRNDGQDQADSVRIFVYSKDSLTQFPTGAELSILAIPGGSSVTSPTPLNLVAPDTADLTETLFARILAARAENTGSRAIIVGASLPADTTANIRVEYPAELKIDSLTFSQASVPANSNDPWYIYAHVRNTGSAPLLLDAITADDVQIEDDYIIVPQPFSPADSVIYPAVGDSAIILAYRVTRTGAQGGQKNVRVEITGTDQNDQTNKQREPLSTPITITTNAKVQISATRIINLPNYEAETDLAHVNTNQVFTVDVVVDNRGAEGLENIWIKLNTPTSRVVGADSIVIASIPVGEQRNARFSVRASSTENLVGEVFTARILRAIGSISKVSAQILTALDATTQIKIYQPATLVIQRTEATTPNPEQTVSYNQEFPIRILLKNNGTEGANTVRLNLTVNNTQLATILTTMPYTLPAQIAGRDSAWVNVSVKAQSISNTATFTAAIISAIGRNSGTAASILPPVDNTASVVIERPAELQVTQVIISEPEVQIGKPWYITAVVRNTGEADIELTSLESSNVKVIIDGEDRVPAAGSYVGYFINPPTQLKVSKNLTLRAGLTDSLIYSVVETGKYAGAARVETHVQGYDKNIGISGVLNAVNFNNVNVTSDAWVRLGKVNITTPHKVEKIGLVNQNQRFAVTVTLETSPIQDVDSVVVELSGTGQSYAVDANGQNQRNLPDTLVYSGRIIKNSTANLTFYLVAAAEVSTGDKLESFRARILKARLPDGAKPASIRLPGEGDDVASIRIQRRAELYATLAFSQVADSLFSINETFSLSASVKNLGTAETGSGGVITLSYPRNYLLEGDSTRNYIVNENVIYRFTAPAFSSLNDRFYLKIKQAAIDLNTNSAAAIRPGGELDSISLSTLEPILYSSDFRISSPQGAVDKILSTEQGFNVRVKLVSSSDLRDRKVRLILPTGFQFVYNDTVKIVNRDTTEVEWSLKAPAQPINEGQLYINASGIFEQNRVKEHLDTLSIRVVSRAYLNLSEFRVIAPSGAMDNIFTIAQDSILIRAVVQNEGSANTSGNGTLILDLKDSGIRLVNAELSEKAFTIGTPVQWYIQAPNTVITQKNIEVRFNTIPNDENTSASAALKETRRTLSVSTEPGGYVRINSFYISEPPGAVDGIISTDQIFYLVGLFEANQLVNNIVKATIKKADGYEVLGLESQDINISEQRVTWKVQAPVIKSVKADTFYFTLSARDRNNDARLSVNSLKLVVQTLEKTVFRLNTEIIDPPGATRRKLSTDQNFRIRARVENDGGAGYEIDDDFKVQITLPIEYGLRGGLALRTFKDPGSGNPYVDYDLVASSTPSFQPDAIRFELISWPRDINTNQPAARRNEGRQELDVETVTKAALSLKAGITNEMKTSATVGIGGIFDVFTDVDNRGVARPDYSVPDGFRFEIKLPENYDLVDSDSSETSSNGKVRWVVKAPITPTETPDTITLFMKDVPPDEYSGVRAAVVDSVVKVLVNVKANVLVLQGYSTAGPQVSAIRGATNLPVLGLHLENPGDDINSGIKINRLSLKFKDANRNLIEPNAIISGIRLVNHRAPEKIYASLTEIPRTNPVDLNCTLADLLINATEPDSVDIVVDLLATSTIPGFSVAIDSSNHIEAIDANSNTRLRVGKEVNAPLISLNIASNFRSVMTPEKAEEGFVNYPNPFGDRNNSFTRFWYYLDKDSELEFRIYSLVGELVLVKKYGPLDRQGQAGIHEGDLIWDGRNGNGNLVRNGIYIAYLNVKGGKSYKTKVAFAK